MSLPIVLLALIYFATIFFGGTHVWAQTVIILSVFLSTFTFLWVQTFKKSQNNQLPVPIIGEPVSLIGLLFLFWTALSLIPLPPEILMALFPKTAQVWKTTALVGGQFPHPLSLYPYMTLNSWIFGLTLLFSYGLVLYGIKAKSQDHFLVVGILALGVAEAIYALLQFARAQPYILWWPKDVNLEVATGTFINRNHTASFLAMIICFGVGYLWALGRDQERNVSNKQAWVYRMGLHMGSFGTRGIILLLALALMMAALLATASRGGTLALLAGLLFMGGLLGSRFFKSRKALLLMLALSLICTYVGYTGLDRVLERFQFLDLDYENRLTIAKDTYRLGQDFPLSGIGLGTFEFAYPGYQSYISDQLVDYAHNDWVQLFAETGWPGLIIFFGGLVWVMGYWIILWRKHQDPFSIGIGLGGLGALVVAAAHSFSDFSLHIPANALLLSLIIALTGRTLYSSREKYSSGKAEGTNKSGLKKMFQVSTWMVVPFLAVMTIFIGTLAWRTVRVWQADSLARTVWNSTIPYKNPSDSDLIKAWDLASGNARYWIWLASRATQKPEIAFQVEKTIKTGSPDINLALLGQGILRSPTAWAIWRELSWAAFFKSVKEPKDYFPLAVKASFQASRLRPFFPQGYLDCGIITLASYARLKGEEVKKPWKEALGQALALNPHLSSVVTDQVLLYLGPEGAKELKGLLPREAQPFLLTGVQLLKKGIYPEGLECLIQGEEYRKREVAGLWEKIVQGKAGPPERSQKTLEQLLTLDPQYPQALLTQGRMLEALNAQERREGVLGELGDLRELSRNLKLLEEQKQGSTAETAYFQGRLAEEGKDYQKARSQFQQAMQSDPQFFPAWVHLEKILEQTQRSEGDRYELENLQKKLHFFEMDRMVGDAWVRTEIEDRSPVWKASFRNRNRLSRLEVDFSGDQAGAWKMLLDGRFVMAWAGKKFVGEKKLMIPVGEHEFKLIAFTANGNPPEKLPFRLSINFN